MVQVVMAANLETYLFALRGRHVEMEIVAFSHAWFSVVSV